VTATVQPLEPPRTASHTRELLILAGPIVLMEVSRLAMTFIDFLMVSQLGTVAQAAISPASFLVFTLNALGLGIASSAQTFVSQADGRKDYRRAGVFAWQCAYLAIAATIVGALASFTAPQWLGWVCARGGATPELAAMEIEYVRLALWSSGPSIVCFGLTGFFNGIQRPGVTVTAMVASIAVNALGNWLLIYGNLGFPRLEIAGAAIATVIGWLVRMAILIVAFRAPRFAEKYATRAGWRYDRAAMRALVRVGVPIGLSWVIDLGAWLAFMFFILPPLGSAVLAASNVGIQYMHLAFMPAIGVSAALSSKVGFSIGARMPSEAEPYARAARRINTIYMGSIGVALFVFGAQIVAWMSADPEVIRAGTGVLRWCGVFQVFDAVAITYLFALRGAGDTRLPAILLGVLSWSIFVLGGFAVQALAPGLSFHGPWAMCTLYIIAAGIMAWLRWESGVWRRIDVLALDGASAPAAAAPGPASELSPPPAEDAFAGGETLPGSACGTAGPL